jgi:hypothetical protein
VRARRLPSVIGFLFAASLITALAQGAAPPLFFVCGSQPTQQTIYVSGVLQGPATALAGFQTGFLQFLTTRFNYHGAVGCQPTNSVQNALNIITSRSAALRNAKKTVIDTGWTESAAAAIPAPIQPPAIARQVPTQSAISAAAATNRSSASAASASPGASAGGSGSAGGGTGTSGTSEIASLLNSIFGGGSGGASGTSKSQGAGAGGGTTAGSSGAVNPMSTAFKGAFSQGSPSPDSLGSADSKTTRLVVYGCGRKDTRVACVTDLTNTNKTDTLVQASDVWQGAFLVDDRGDRHQRSNGFFLNIDNDQRSQIDITYGKSARFVLMFDGVSAKVQKVTLRSTTDGLDVEDITLQAQ